MVQRKLPNKHGIQADHVKSEKLLGNLKKKPTSCQHQDGKKNRGPEMKKKMKRSRSIKLSDVDSLKISPSRKPTSQPGKPPPLDGPTAIATPPPQKQPLNRATDGSPNYMKSTSCSEAKKESFESKNLRRRNSSGSEFSSSAKAKPSRTLTRTSSLKLMKSPSFKPTAKKSSRVLLCSDINVQKATCSSTLKDSKFPAYLMLNPGGTEAEGTSAIKVCPYTYCSLNGHHHSPLPPLKYFLKARRRSLKTQKSMKSNDLSPRTANLSSGGMGEISCGARGFPDEELAHCEAGAIDSVHSPTIRDVGADFFIEIYANNKLDDAESTQRSSREFVGVPEEQSNNEFYRNEESVAAEIKNEYEELVTAGSFDGNETATDCCFTSTEEDNISEVTDMEWEEGQLSSSDLDAEADHVNKFESELEKPFKFDEFYISKKDEIVSNCTEDIVTDDVLQELFEEEETYSFDLRGNDIHEKDNEISGPNQLQDSEHHQEDISLQADDDAIMPTQNQVRTDQDAETMASTADQELPESEIGDAIEYQEQMEDVRLVGSQISYSSQSSSEVDGDGELSNYFNDESGPNKMHKVVENQDLLGEDRDGASKLKIHVESEQNGDLRIHIINLDNSNYRADNEKIEDKDCFKSDTAEILVTDNEGTSPVSHCAMLHVGSNSEPELPSTCSKRTWTIQSKKSTKESEEQWQFNPREPNFLPVVPDPEAEKVDLKHQDMDVRKNAEEWMLDYALQKAVTKLAPARKKKVALLVEAFETVLPIPKYNTSTSFDHSRPIQACS